ncbi:TraI domain-containing protein [Paraburkholderia sp. USG1]|uniref:MobH family relaxase n=1 Tax=Paraburkholderia sp. USG1 TaxID=2952268 RepID=UPI0028571496|nr:MobH family relaxase [Paraburkholderia sp. USG1]MDR8399519.1 TraI domain-containing protein [Paraburkholderia sp. USG1]
MAFSTALAWLRLSVPASARPHQAASPPASSSAPVVLRPAPSAQHLPVLGYVELLDRSGMQGAAHRIGSSVGLSTDNERRDVEPLIERLTEFVQLLPASESHHHAQPGGLLIHLFEVARYALRFREGYRLPLGASPEDQMRHGARCSYAVLIAALLHDIGKPLADLKVQLVSGTDTRRWVPLAGSMNEQGGQWYQVDFPDPAQRDYGAHARLPIVLLQRLVPSATLGWLAQYPPVLDELAAYLSGDGATTDGALAKIVGEADRRSVAQNLLAGPRTRFATARTVPLIERLMEGLRRLLAEGELPLNRAGATGYCDGESLWCVAKTLAEAVRSYLARHEQQQPGAAGIPSDNNRLFDTWQEYGALVPTPEGGAIWTVEITVGTWKQNFTVLRFPLERLYADPGRYPRALAVGAVRVLEAGKDKEAGSGEGDSSGAAADVQSAPRETEGPGPAVVADASPPSAEAHTEELGAVVPMLLVIPDRHGAAGDGPALALGTDVSGPASHDDAADFLPDAESASALQAEASHEREVPKADGPVPDEVTSPVRPKQKAKVPAKSVASREGGRQPRPNAERFLAWVQEGVATGALPYNESMARVHFVPEGMLLVTPAVFRDFAQAHPEAIEQTPTDDGRTPEPWKQVQRDFQKSGYPVAADSGGAGRSYLIHYNIKGAGGRQLSVMLVPEPERFFNPVPPPNAMIQSKQKPAQDRDGPAQS